MKENEDKIRVCQMCFEDSNLKNRDVEIVSEEECANLQEYS